MDINSCQKDQYDTHTIEIVDAPGFDKGIDAVIEDGAEASAFSQTDLELEFGTLDYGGDDNGVTFDTSEVTDFVGLMAAFRQMLINGKAVLGRTYVRRADGTEEDLKLPPMGPLTRAQAFSDDLLGSMSKEDKESFVGNPTRIGGREIGSVFVGTVKSKAKTAKPRKSKAAKPAPVSAKLLVGALLLPNHLNGKACSDTELFASAIAILLKARGMFAPQIQDLQCVRATDIDAHTAKVEVYMEIPA
jgi:hypothetical protein